MDWLPTVLVLRVEHVGIVDKQLAHELCITLLCRLVHRGRTSHERFILNGMPVWVPPSPTDRLFGSGNDVGRQVGLGRSLLPDRSNRLEMHEDIGHELALEWERTSVDDGVRFVEHEIAGFHGDVGGPTIVTNDLERPRFVHVLIDIDDRRADQGKAVHMRREDGASFVHANTVQTALCQLLTRPFRDCVPRCIPYGLLEDGPAALEPLVLDADHLELRIPMINVGVRGAPVFRRLVVLVRFPEVLDEVEDLLRRLDLGVAGRRVIHHALWLSEVHVHAALVVVSASLFGRLLLLSASLHQTVVECILVAQDLDRHSLILLGGWNGRIHVVWKPRVVGGRIVLVHGI
mmetsp:Transcript_19360/g.53860  ORF Transcript_19360/g.53860 Transcript_19360/m.53860 type:complete len:347 (+) Transcript_19360:322-1362(+)